MFREKTLDEMAKAQAEALHARACEEKSSIGETAAAIGSLHGAGVNVSHQEAIAQRAAAYELSGLIGRELGIGVEPNMLRLFLRCHWWDVSRLAAKAAGL